MSGGLDERYYRLALSQAKKNNLSGAVRYARVSLALNGENAKARTLFGICLYELGETAPAFETLYGASEWPGEARDELTRTEAYFERLRVYIGQNKLRRALSAAKDAPRQSVRVLNVRGCLYARAGRYGEAARFFAQALEKDCGNPLAAGLIEAVKRRKRFWRGI